MWSRDGRELFYRASDDLMSVAVNTTGALTLGERKKVADLSGYDAGQFHEFDVSSDGQRFLLLRTDPSSRPVRLDIIVNWLDDSKRRSPPDDPVQAPRSVLASALHVCVVLEVPRG
jgi:hypothetical protein